MYKILNIILFFLVLYLIIIIYKSNKENKEKFQDKCNDFYKDGSFCQYNIRLKKCGCYFQKDGINKAFKAPEDCCKNKCVDYDEKDCNFNDKLYRMNYFCNIAGKCLEYSGTSLNSRISENSCGLSRLSQNLVLPYQTKEQCEKDNNECKVHNDPYRSSTYNKKQCLKNPNCGFCTNEFSEGICVEGNSDGPLDKLKFGDLCKVGDNYFYGQNGRNKENFENRNQKYCNINGTCTEMVGENCGVNKLNGQFNSIFKDLKDCENDTLVCEKYNKKNRSNEENKSECLKDVKCGYCTNNNKCVIGTAEGPNNINLNYACIPNLNYEYGDHATYII